MRVVNGIETQINICKCNEDYFYVMFVGQYLECLLIKENDSYRWLPITTPAAQAATIPSSLQIPFPCISHALTTALDTGYNIEAFDNRIDMYKELRRRMA